VTQHWFIGTIAPSGKGEYCVHIGPPLRYRLEAEAKYPVEPAISKTETTGPKPSLADALEKARELSALMSDWVMNPTLVQAGNECVYLVRMLESLSEQAAGRESK
jgi:hypothetical protein